MSDAAADSIDVPGPEVLRRTLFEPDGTLVYRRQIPDNELLIKLQLNRSVKHAAVSLAEVHNVHLWADNQTLCFYDSYDGVYESLTMEHKPINWDTAVGTPVQEMPGTTILFPHLDPHNYYHWLIDTMPCFGILDRAGIAVSSADHVYVHRMINQFQWSMLEMMGVEKQRVIFNQSGDSHYLFERLLVPDFRLFGGGWPNPWCARYLKQRFASNDGIEDNTDANTEPRKLYIARGKARRTILNEEALIQKLETLGYEILHPHAMSFSEQVSALRDVDFVLSSHGAGLANIVFCKSGVKLMEFGGHYITVHFRMLAEYCGADYRAIAAGLDESGNRLPISYSGTVRNKDFVADINLIVERSEEFYRESFLAVA